SMLMLGKIYQHLLGNIEYAFKYYLQAARKNIPEAQRYVGLAFYIGCYPLPQDQYLGICWLTLSAKNGDLSAASSLKHLKDT
ncbi:MAG: hypothetical protein ACPGEF_06865, partial [Endozoicomonas sp.]